MYKVVEEGKEWMVVKVIFTKGNSSRGGDNHGTINNANYRLLEPIKTKSITHYISENER
jgi:hypothetical protein